MPSASRRVVQIHKVMLSEIGQQSTARFLGPNMLTEVPLTILAVGERILVWDYRELVRRAALCFSLRMADHTPLWTRGSGGQPSGDALDSVEVKGNSPDSSLVFTRDR